MKTELGVKYTDIVTGFTGVAIGRCEYITGCSQVLIAPRCKDESSKPDAEWIDEQRLEIHPFHEQEPKVVLDNGVTPGCDRAAPKI